MKRILALLIACLALTLASCGGDDNKDDGGGGSSGSSATTEQTGTGSADTGGDTGGGSAAVDMKDIKFVPEDLTVPKGTKVTWTNSDQVPHTVTKDGGPGPDFDSGNVEPGGEFEQTFDEAGTVDYVCTIHPGQSGKITVE
jgi:plastocyanin